MASCGTRATGNPSSPYNRSYAGHARGTHRIGVQGTLEHHGARTSLMCPCMCIRASLVPTPNHREPQCLNASQSTSSRRARIRSGMMHCGTQSSARSSPAPAEHSSCR